MAPALLGQNFLAGEGWRERIFTLLDARPNDVWIEIGAGHGEMTELLAGRAARVIALELDPLLAAGLRKRAADWPTVEIVEEDVLTADLAQIAARHAVSRIRKHSVLHHLANSPPHLRCICSCPIRPFNHAA